MQVFIYCKITLHVPGVHRTHHQEYIKLTAASGTGHITYRCNNLPPTWPYYGPNKTTLEEGCCSDTVTCTRGCSYSFMYS